MSGIHKEKWKVFIARLRKYVHYYGGWGEIFGSSFFNLAVVFSVINLGLWQEKWTSLALSLIPSLLGFSLGTDAILFSIISVRLKRALKEVKNPYGIPYLHEMNATFFHFIFIQVVAIMLSFVHGGTPISVIGSIIFDDPSNLHQLLHYIRYFPGAIGTMLVFYSLLLAVAAALIVYRLATIVEPDKGDS